MAKCPYKNDQIMPFGKHFGEHMSEVPTSYLQWALEKMTFKNKRLKSDIQTEYDSRDDWVNPEEGHYDLTDAWG